MRRLGYGLAAALLGLAGLAAGFQIGTVLGEPEPAGAAVTCAVDKSLPMPVVGPVIGGIETAQKTVEGAAGPLPANLAKTIGTAGPLGCTFDDAGTTTTTAAGATTTTGGATTTTGGATTSSTASTSSTSSTSSSSSSSSTSSTATTASTAASTTSVTAASATTASVLGATVQQTQLPRTGSQALRYALAGASLLIIGVGLRFGVVRRPNSVGRN